MNRPVHFEMHVQDPERAMAFYRSTFGWDFQKYAGPFDYWLITTGKDAPGIDGGMIRRMGNTPGMREPTPVIAFVCTMDVADIDKAMSMAEKAGAVQALPKNAIPTMGWTAYYKDPEGNIFGLFKADKSAK
jgi:predicted enzyme related to lactoylglutathione lyase